jgi:hypothetical protein
VRSVGGQTRVDGKVGEMEEGSLRRDLGKEAGYIYLGGGAG